MQATLDGSVLKQFTRALACLSRYGDELCIYATPDDLSLSATNSSKSAYCRFRYDRQFFTRYRVGPTTLADDVQEVVTVNGQLLTKPLLSILKHKTIEKTVERCEFSIVEGGESDDEMDEDKDGLESKLILRLHCKHGVVKTHRLLLSTPTSLLTPRAPESSAESQLSIGPRAIRDIVEHFPTKGAKSDPQLIWNFGEAEVEVKSLESSLDSKGKNQLSTELTIQADEFDVYDLYAAPTVIAFHLREFNAAIAFAESMSLSVDLRFTETAAPLFITTETDGSNALFVISTTQVAGAPSPSSQIVINPRKRIRDGEESNETPRRKKPMKVVLETDVARSSVARSKTGSSSTPRSSATNPIPPGSEGQPNLSLARSPPLTPEEQVPLFLPGSQLSQADAEPFEPAIEEQNQINGDVVMDDLDDFALIELAPTQSSDRSKDFRPLFDD